MAKAQEEKVGFFTRLKQIGMVFQFTAKQDKLFVPLVAAAVVVPVGVTVLLSILLGFFRNVRIVTAALRAAIQIVMDIITRYDGDVVARC